MSTTLSDLSNPTDLVELFLDGPKIITPSVWVAPDNEGEKVIGCGRAVRSCCNIELQGGKFRQREARRLCQLLRMARSKRLGAGCQIQVLGMVHGDGAITVIADRTVPGRRALLAINSLVHGEQLIPLDTKRLNWLIEELRIAFVVMDWEFPE